MPTAKPFSVPDLKSKTQRVRRNTPKTEIAVVAGDFHLGDHDPEIISLFLYFIKRIQPKRVILNGDITDQYSTSRYDKCPEKELYQLQMEIDLGNEFLDEIQTIPKVKIDFLEGNHDVRVAGKLKKDAQSLYKLNAVTMDSLLSLSKRNIAYIPYRDSLVYGDMMIWHGDKASKHTAATYVADWGVSGIFNHTHRIQQFSHRYADGRNITVYMNGCLQNLSPEYSKGRVANWQHGWCVVTKVGGRCFVDQIRVEGGSFFYGGEIFYLGCK